MLKLIACSLKVVPISKIGEGVGRYNAISLLVFFKVLINANKCLEVIFQ